MALPVFDATWLPEVGASKQQTPRIKKIPFGNGYEQRSADGININKEIWPLTFKGDPVKIQAIDDFLIARNSLQAFEWVTPEAKTIAVTCSSWTHTWDDFGWHTLTAEFNQVFEK